MNCIWEEVPNSSDARGWRRVRCVKCGLVSNPTPHEFAQIHSMCGGTVRRSGPGHELTKLLHQLGIRPDKCNNECAKMARRMDQWGEACLEPEHFAEICEHIKRAYSKTDWPTVLRVAWVSLATGLAWEIDWTDPLPSLVRVAVERSRKVESRA